MCFVCSEFEGFDTDISKIIGLTRNSNFGLIQKERAPISNQKIYSSLNSETNQTLDQAKLIFSDESSKNKDTGDYQTKTDFDFIDINEKTLLTSSEEALSRSFRDIGSMINIKDTFDPITGLITDAAKISRLYDAAFQSLPDADDLEYWIEKYRSGENNARTIASSFLGFTEFAKKFGNDISDENYVRNLYQNVLERAPDNSGMNYWLGQLTSGTETRDEVFLGFSESAENKAIFNEITGFG
tara:strand:- start:2510 stop:3235 length:726 start_codon:yes stop_codon:yes gene_type:complete